MLKKYVKPQTAEGADDIFKEVDTEDREEVEWVKYQKVIDFARLDQDGVVYTCKAHFGEDEVVHHSFTLEITDTGGQLIIRVGMA